MSSVQETLMDEDRVMQYLDFVEERHRVWERRQRYSPPWTDDPVLAKNKFTNVYRVLDHGSQFLLRELLRTSKTPADALLRSYLYRYTNRPEPWEFFHDLMGRYPVRQDLKAILPGVWQTAKSKGCKMFGTAYHIFPGREGGVSQLTWVLRVTLEHLEPQLDRIVEVGNLGARLELLQTVPRCGPFMSMQIATDYGYSLWGQGDENECVIPGPGAIAGARIIAPEMKPVKVIEEFWSNFHTNSHPRLALPDGRTRPPSLMDVQNTLCEYSKFARYADGWAGRPYQPSHPGPQPRPTLPEHW